MKRMQKIQCLSLPLEIPIVSWWIEFTEIVVLTVFLPFWLILKILWALVVFLFHNTANIVYHQPLRTTEWVIGYRFLNRQHRGRGIEHHNIPDRKTL